MTCIGSKLHILLNPLNHDGYYMNHVILRKENSHYFPKRHYATGLGNGDVAYFL
jgi:hypothetical protein